MDFVSKSNWREGGAFIRDSRVPLLVKLWPRFEEIIIGKVEAIQPRCAGSIMRRSYCTK